MFFHLRNRRKPRFLQGVLQVACSSATPKSSEVCSCPQIMLVLVDSRRCPEHVFSLPATGERYQKKTSKREPFKAKLAPSLELSATLARKVRQTGTPATFCRLDRAQSKRPKCETVRNSSLQQRQFCTSHMQPLPSAKL